MKFLIAVIIGLIVYVLLYSNINKRIVNGIRDMNYKYFNYDEFDTPAVVGIDDSSKMYSKNGRNYVKDSGLLNMQASHLNKLDKARDIIEKEYNNTNPNNKIVFKINSGFRSPQYNKWLDDNTDYQVAKTSSHMLGLASDISTSGYSNDQIKVMLNALRRAGFVRFGLGQTFIHVDNDTAKTQNISWNYGADSINIDPFTA